MRNFFILVASLILLACQSNRDAELSGFHMPYRVAVHQGNIISPESVAQLRSGLNKDMVQKIMGSPLIVDTFHQDHWTYVQIERLGAKYKARKVLNLYFQNEKLVKII